jgi:hypothetical protein
MLTIILFALGIFFVTLGLYLQWYAHKKYSFDPPTMIEIYVPGIHPNVKKGGILYFGGRLHVATKRTKTTITVEKYG